MPGTAKYGCSGHVFLMLPSILITCKLAATILGLGHVASLGVLAHFINSYKPTMGVFWRPSGLLGSGGWGAGYGLSDK